MFLKLLIFFIFISFVESLCPSGALEWKSKCFLYEKNETGYASAEIACMNLNGHLASVHDAFTNMVLGTEAQNYFHESTQADFWIGGDNIEVAQKWSWTDGTPFDYSDWKTGEPQNTTGSNCIALSLTEAYWSADDCFKPKPYVCLVPSSTTTPKATTLETTTKRVLACPSDWIYLNYTGYCYKVYHNQLNWNGAEQVCTVVGGHIASIHSNTENDFLGNLQFEGRGIWLGFYLNLTYPFEWIWSDGTPVDYTNWSIGQPDGRGGTGCTEFYGHYAWNDIPCDHIYNNFVCKKYRSYI